MSKDCCEKCDYRSWDADGEMEVECRNNNCPCHKKECCEKCGHHGVGCVPSCYPKHCHNSNCSCHSPSNKDVERVEAKPYKKITATELMIQQRNHPTEGKKDWEEEFDAQFPKKYWMELAIKTYHHGDQTVPKEIKSFITHLLTTEREKERERIFAAAMKLQSQPLDARGEDTWGVRLPRWKVFNNGIDEALYRILSLLTNQKPL